MAVMEKTKRDTEPEVHASLKSSGWRIYRTK
jgi:hypothetical protein